MLMTPEIIAILLLDTIFLFFGFIAFVISVVIAWKWNLNSSSSLQYKLEKQSFLVATIIKYIFLLKLPLFLFFIFTADKLSNVITGAMCGAGVVNSVSFGLTLFVYKILNLYIFGFWLVLHSYDMKEESLPFTRAKFILYAVGFFFLIIEIYYEVSFFLSLDVSKIVSCCGTLFSAASSSAISVIFAWDKMYFVYAFYLLYLFVVVGYILKNDILMLVSNIFYILVSILSLIMFFGTYIYELPTHHCPFCLLQRDYYYIGYFLYTTLYIGTFYGISGSIMSMIKRSVQVRYYKISLLFNTLYAILVSAYPLSYYYRNGVWL